MRSLILSAASPIIAKLSDDIFTESPELALVIFFEQKIILDLFAFCNGFDQGNLFGTQDIEDGLNIRSLHAGLVFIQERVVRMIGRWEEGNIPLYQLHHLLKMWPEDRKIRSGL